MSVLLRITSPILVGLLLATTPPPGRGAGEDYARALDFLDGGQTREAVAVLAAAARAHPGDLKIGSLLYTLLRDKHWPVPRTLPVQLGAAITAVDFSPDGSLVIAGAADGAVRILDVESGGFTSTKIKHPAAVLGVRIAPGNEQAFSVGRAGVAQMWEVKTGKPIWKWQRANQRFTAFATTPTLSLVALGYADGEVIVYSKETGAAVGEPVKHAGAITALEFARDGSALATASADGTARIWDVSTMKPRDFVVHHKAPLTSVDIARSGKQLLTTSKDGIATVSDAANGHSILPGLHCGASILQAAFGPSGLRFHTVLADHTVRIWDSTTGEPVEGVIRSEHGIVHADWGPAGIRMVTASDRPTADIWRVQDGQRIGEGMLHDAPVRVVAFGPDGHRVATGCANGSLRVWRQDLGTMSEGIPTVRRQHGPVRTAYFSQDEDAIVSASEDLTAMLWDRRSLKPSGRALAHAGHVTCAALSPDRKFIATTCADGTAALWNATTHDPIGGPLPLGAPGTWVDFSPDGKQFVTAAGSKSVIWSVEPVSAIAEPLVHPGNGLIHAVRFSPDGKWVATAGDDQTVCIWDAKTHRLEKTLKKHDAAVLNLGFSFDGSRLATSGADGHIFTWDTSTWEQTGTTAIMPGEVWSVAISPDNRFVLATSIISRGVRFFEIATGRPFTTGIDLPTDALCVDIARSGDVVLAGCADGTVRGYGSPFVQEDVPGWLPDFAEKLIGLRAVGPKRFARVASTLDDLQAYLEQAAKAPDADFSRLARWLLTPGSERSGMPRTQTSIADAVAARVEERSLDALLECLDAAPTDPLVLAALSLYVPTQTQGEYLAEFALERAAKKPLAQAYCASTFAKYGRMEEAENSMRAALTAAPDEPRVLRRAARLDARQKRKDAAITKLDRCVALDGNDPETYRTYGWVLFNLGEAARALEQFRKGQNLTGGADDDIDAGICLAAAATGDEAAAISQYQHLVKHSPEWGNADYLKKLTGWSEKELGEMERIRALAVSHR